MTALPDNLSSTLHGIGVSPGLALASACTLRNRVLVIQEHGISPEQLPGEMERLRKATAKTLDQLQKLRAELQQTLGEEHSQIVDFHIELLSDTELYGAIVENLEEKKCCLEQAVSLAIREACSPLESSGKPFFQERAADIRDVGTRLLNCLAGTQDFLEQLSPEHPVILLAEEIPPSVVARLTPASVAAILSSGGSRTSHTAILARALGIPAIVAVQEPLGNIPDGTTIAVDADQGIAHVSPNAQTKLIFQQRQQAQRDFLAEIRQQNGRPAETLDGYQAALVANVALPEEALQIARKYQTGIGLFRTEFLFLDGRRPLSEEEQFRIYAQTVRATYPYSVIFRTLDIGGDKLPDPLQLQPESNPFLGLRGIRYALQHPEMLHIQLRALLRATTEGKMRILFPMVSTRDEMRHVIRLLEDVKRELDREHVPFSDDFDVGCMIEVPAAAQLADRLIDLVDFFSLGTNDLTQYTLAVDRANPAVAPLYQPAHPAVLRQLQQVVNVAYDNGKWLSICGEMAGECLYTPLILGLGIHELSMSPLAIPKVRKVLQSLKVYEAEQLVHAALQCEDGREVISLCREFLNKSCPDLLQKIALPSIPYTTYA